MSAHRNTLRINLACIIVAAGLALPAGLGIGFAAEQPSPEDIIRGAEARADHARTHRIPGDAARRAEEARLCEHLAQPADPFAHDHRA